MSAETRDKLISHGNISTNLFPRLKLLFLTDNKSEERRILH